MTDFQLAKLRQLTSFLTTAKHEEKLARDKRIEIEEKIAALVDGPEAGQRTVDLGDKLRVTVTRGFNYKADLAAIDQLFTDMPNFNVPAPIKTKTTRELDVTGYEWFRKNYESIFSDIAKHVEVKPKKVAVEVKGL